MSFEDDIEDLDAAEDFLQYFKIEYDQTTVHVNRLHILQRFHDYLNKAQDTMPEDETAKKAVYTQLLARAYQDFVESDAQTEKVFKVFKMAEPQQVFISLTDIQS
ncbi:MAG: nitrogenase-stabilizing/protective protein NifW [Methylococcaceae bacterium]|nr:nitrogenase-stabilizing/protective protein NifW [Methylococcaceae bacterium]